MLIHANVKYIVHINIDVVNHRVIDLSSGTKYILILTNIIFFMSFDDQKARKKNAQRNTLQILAQVSINNIW